jgi:hypothetical protein
MWRIALSAILVLASAQAETVQNLLLPDARHIGGLVVDVEGKPIAEAQIDHSNRRGLHRTDSDGKFEMDTRAPALVVRKVGFRSELVRTQTGAEVTVVLRKLSQGRTLPICSNSRHYEGIDGWTTSSLRFPRISGVKVSRQGHDVDYGIRSYYVETEQGRKGIRHGSGLMWSSGTPLDEDVWRSVKYEEDMFDVEGVTIIDARGQMANGDHWRSLGKVFESASYRDVDEETAKILDKVLDGACLKSAKPK